MEEQKNISDILKELLERRDRSVLKTVLMDLHPADIAEASTRLSGDEKEQIFKILDIQKSGEVLIELDSPTRQGILNGLTEEKLVEIVGSLDSDDATDLIGELDREVAERILAAMPWKEFREVKTLLRHEEDTAGGIMALEIVAVEQSKTTQEALEVLRRKADEVEDVYNIYVIDNQGVLKGLVSLKDLVLSDSEVKLSDIMDGEPVSVYEEMDQEQVANLFRKYDLVAAPVINQEGRLVGRITVDDVLQVVEEETNEDFTMMAGITDEEIREQSLFKISSVRLPWLLVAFAGEIASAGVMQYFKASLDQIITAAFFIPLIMAMGGNMGIQSSTVIIRGLATGEISLRDSGQRLLKEMVAAFFNGLIITILLLGIVTFWFHKPKFGLVLGVALLAVLFNATFMGTLIPLLLKKINVDPAIATGPFITTSNDILGLLVYFGIISFSLTWL